MRLNGLAMPLAALCMATSCIGVSAHTYKYQQLYSFCPQASCTDGAAPQGGLVMDPAGNIYGTTSAMGENGSGGTVFKLSHDGRKWKFKTLYSFCSETNCTDGSYPLASMILDTAGNLYGTAASQGANHGGVVFKLDPNASGRKRYTDVYDFCAVPADDGGCKDGNAPSGTLTYDGADTGAPYDGTSPLYGTTRYGGDAGLGWGTVFELHPGNKRWREDVLYALCRKPNCADGSTPWSGVILSGGVFYGTTKDGGSNQPVPSGVVFALTSKGQESVLYTFCPDGGLCADGATPLSPLIVDSGGNLAGTTYYGGANSAGTVFEIVGGSERVLHDFCAPPSCTDSKNPTAGLIMDPSGNLYGTASGYNGASGTVFDLKGTREQDIYEFCCGHVLLAGLIRDAAGNLYGASYNGGDSNSGNVFELKY
jgi:uncharacterized repeat protein (TIGR03803 family)